MRRRQPQLQGDTDRQRPDARSPPSDTGLQKVADPAYVFRGKTWITLNGSSMTVKNTTMNLNNVVMALPSNGVIYVDNDATTGCSGGYNAINPYGDTAGCGDAFVRAPTARI